MKTGITLLNGCGCSTKLLMFRVVIMRHTNRNLSNAIGAESKADQVYHSILNCLKGFKPDAISRFS
ncbi:hypothetical protein SCA6_009407 [Theobroma cacao]